MAAPDAGSPKFQLQEVIFPGLTVDRSVKPVGVPIQTVVDAKAVTGSGCTVTGTERESLQPSGEMATSVVINVP